jgi:predicted transcriptional regulator
MQIASRDVILRDMARTSAKQETVFDAPDEEREEKAWAEGEADIDAGRTVPHAKVKRWLESWGTAKELPAPRWRKRK